MPSPRPWAWESRWDALAASSTGAVMEQCATSPGRCGSQRHSRLAGSDRTRESCLRRRIFAAFHPTQLYAAFAGVISWRSSARIIRIAAAMARGDGAAHDSLFAYAVAHREPARGDESAIFARMTLSQNISLGLFLLWAGPLGSAPQADRRKACRRVRRREPGACSGWASSRRPR